MARQRRFLSRGPRRETDWGEGPGSSGVSSISGSATTIIGSGMVITVGASTLVRLRGLLDIFLTSSTSAGDGFFGAFGIGVVTSRAFAAGVTALPQPVTEIDWDGWMYHTFISVHEGSPDGPGDAGVHRIEVDSKAMRKMDGDVTLVGVLQVFEIGTAAASVFFDSRVLIKQG